MKNLIHCFCVLFFFACSTDNGEEPSGDLEISGECTLGRAKFFIDRNVSKPRFDDICFQSCQPVLFGNETKNVKVTECGKQIGYKLEYSFQYAREILNADNEQCTKKGDILTCYESIIIDERNGRVSVFNVPEGIDDNFQVKIKDEYFPEYMNEVRLVISTFEFYNSQGLELSLKNDPKGSVSAEICKFATGWKETQRICPAFPRPIPDYDIDLSCLPIPPEKFTICLPMPRDLEFYISYGTKEEILNADNEQCVEEDSTLTCYRGIVIYDLYGKILINEQSLNSSLANHPCSGDGLVCTIMVKDKRGDEEPLKIMELH
ncbi:MAG: hypothetical protein LBC87_00715 [Fibromonadaceae bacterium]|jgi:hypothetical protein|nr:hypothetical protein [Fibromonadaceae bacterium]